tara:strand:- start:160 stop:351 length:192 start_codon:yes stop_codon:yes gene_type:complete
VRAIVLYLFQSSTQLEVTPDTQKEMQRCFSLVLYLLATAEVVFEQAPERLLETHARRPVYTCH